MEFGVWSVELSGYSVSLCYFEKTVILRSVATKNLSGTTTFLKKIPHYVRDDSQLVILRNLAYMLF